MKKIHILCVLFVVTISLIFARLYTSEKETELVSEIRVEDLTSKEMTPTYTPDPGEVVIAARLIYAEAGKITSTMEKAAVVWCALNRVDSPKFPNSLAGVVEQPGQFAAYSRDLPVTPENQKIAIDVLTRYHEECRGAESVGRVLPKSYIYYRGNGKHNYFTEEFLGWESWMFDCENPYEN